MAEVEMITADEMTDDFDMPDWLNLTPSPIVPVPTIKRGRGKLILLEDILKDKRKKNLKGGKKNLKKGRAPKGGLLSSSDEDDSGDEEGDVAKRIRIDKVEETLNKFGEIIAETEVETFVKWGELAFGPRKPFPEFSLPEDDTGLISRVLKFEPQKGTDRTYTVASMASNGLLLSWAALERRCDETTARCLFNQMAYSKNGFVEKSSCKLLCDLLLKQTRGGKPVCEMEWLPNLEDIMDTFRVYGYLDACDDDDGNLQSAEPNILRTVVSSQGEETEIDDRDGPPPNIRSLLQFLVPYFQSRRRHLKLSTTEAESLVRVFIRCRLDRCMLNVSDLLGSCFEALIECFSEEEWTSSCINVASVISRVSSSFVNNLRVARSLHATNNRFRALQRLVVLQLLARRVEAKKDLSCPEDVVSIFKSVSLKDKACNFVNLHYLLQLADIYLWSDSSVTKTKRVFGPWLDLLKKCATQISLQDARPYSMKVRNWASFLSQKYQIEGMHTSTAPP